MQTPSFPRRSFLTATAGAAAVLAAGQAASASTFRASEFFVTNETELQAALASAGPGDVIKMENRTWNDLDIVIGAASNHGAPGMPITLQAETLGSVVLSGVSTLAIGRNYWAVYGLVFENGHSTLNKPVIDFSADGSEAQFSRIRHIKIENYNPPDNAQYVWVNIPGQNNRVSHSYFSGKTNRLAVVFGKRASATPTNHRIDHNYIGDIATPCPIANSYSAIVTDTTHFSSTDDNWIIEHNLFRNCNGETEIISVKSSSNTIRHNTFVECWGYISLRQGNATDIYGNYILAYEASSSGGIRVTGADHRIYNNYIDGNAGRCAIGIHNGWDTGDPLSSYWPVDNVAIVHNTIVNSSVGIDVGWPFNRGVNNVPPQSFNLANNIVWNAYESLLRYATAPVSPAYQANVVHGGNVGICPVPSGISQVDPLMEQVSVAGYSIYRPESLLASPVIDDAAGSYAYVDIDIEGKGRPAGSSSDIGAHEDSPDPVLFPPLTGADVGPNYMTIS